MSELDIVRRIIDEKNAKIAELKQQVERLWIVNRHLKGEIQHLKNEYLTEEQCAELYYRGG
jgi:regulator of replication initiation timing